jgi:hypothetical protein
MNEFLFQPCSRAVPPLPPPRTLPVPASLPLSGDLRLDVSEVRFISLFFLLGVTLQRLFDKSMHPYFFNNKISLIALGLMWFKFGFFSRHKKDQLLKDFVFHQVCDGISSVQITVSGAECCSSPNATSPTVNGKPSRADLIRMKDLIMGDTSMEAS